MCGAESGPGWDPLPHGTFADFNHRRFSKNGWIMRRVFAVTATKLAAVSLILGGCSSMPSLDMFKSEPPAATLKLESEPSGAMAKTSAGPGCVTPCAVVVPAKGSLTVTYTLDKFQPATVAINAVEIPADQNPEGTGAPGVGFDPNPAFAQLEPAGPQKKKKAAPPPRKRTPPPPRRAAPAPEADAPPPPQGGSPFPPPPGSQPRQ